MNATQKIKINVIVAERSYRITVNSSDEEKVRKAVDLVNQNVKRNKESNIYRDFQDLLSMSCLQFATENVKYEADHTYRDQCLEQKLDELSALLDENLDS